VIFICCEFCFFRFDDLHFLLANDGSEFLFFLEGVLLITEGVETDELFLVCSYKGHSGVETVF
jgi:hypothetical protein